MPAARMALVVYALTTAFAGAELLLSRKELYREILRQLAPSGFHKARPTSGPAWYDFEDGFAAPAADGPECSAPDVLKADKRTTCRPRKRLVQLPPGPPEVLRLPRLVEIERCEGSCHQRGRSCRPVAARVIAVQVVRVNVTSGKPQAQCAEEHLERHEKCTCMCELDKSHCTSQQVFVESICACHCPDLAEMHLCNGPDRRWDSATCQCTCLEGECSTGFHFSKKECRCVPMEEHRS
ncbi:vascular endothelial growth factor A-like [Amblyomma americanum]